MKVKANLGWTAHSFYLSLCAKIKCERETDVRNEMDIVKTGATKLSYSAPQSVWLYAVGRCLS